jgi:hypothetical protein
LRPVRDGAAAARLHGPSLLVAWSLAWLRGHLAASPGEVGDVGVDG